jgi:hypothetical protein
MNERKHETFYPSIIDGEGVVWDHVSEERDGLE